MSIVSARGGLASLLLLSFALAAFLPPTVGQVSCGCRCCFDNDPDCMSSAPYSLIGTHGTLDGNCASVDCQARCSYSRSACNFGLYETTPMNKQSFSCIPITPAAASPHPLTGRWTVNDDCNTSACCCPATLSIATLQPSDPSSTSRTLYGVGERRQQCQSTRHTRADPRRARILRFRAEPLYVSRSFSTRRLAIQEAAELVSTTWPRPDVPMQLHLDFTVPDRAALERHRERALTLGATEILDRSDDPDEALYVLTDSPRGRLLRLVPR